LTYSAKNIYRLLYIIPNSSIYIYLLALGYYNKPYKIYGNIIFKNIKNPFYITISYNILSLEIIYIYKTYNKDFSIFNNLTRYNNIIYKRELIEYS